MLEQEQFLSEYRISAENFKKANISWETLMEIYSDYLLRRPILEDIASFIVNCFKKEGKVHSSKFRTKDPEHLLEKIIRKKIDNPDREFNKNNYCGEITDLIGVRILHLFKDDWDTIHNYIKTCWNLKEDVKANIRDGDSTEKFEKKGCSIKEHPMGYRSVHYVVKLEPQIETIFAEIQVRTIFEEAWSEIDHQMRYPYHTDNELLNSYLEVFNRLAGSADEMGTYIKLLVTRLKETEQMHKEELAQKDQKIKALNERINQLKISESEKSDIKASISNIVKNSSSSSSLLSGLIPDSASSSLLSGVFRDSASSSLLSGVFRDSVSSSLLSGMISDSASSSLLSGVFRDSASSSLLSGLIPDSASLSLLSGVFRDSASSSLLSGLIPDSASSSLLSGVFRDSASSSLLSDMIPNSTSSLLSSMKLPIINDPVVNKKQKK